MFLKRIIFVRCFITIRGCARHVLRDVIMKKTMKIMALVLFVIGMTAMTSCSKSKDKLIVGKWKLETITASYQGISQEIDPSLWYDEDVYMEFTSDGKVISDGETASYSIEDDVLIMTDDYETIRVTIVELTKSTLVLAEEEDGVSMELHFSKV